MRRALLNLSIGGRLGASFVVLCILLAVVVAAGLHGSSRQQAVAAENAQLQGPIGTVIQLRYLDAEVSGWEGYIFSKAAVEGGAKAIAVDDYNIVGLNKARAEAYKLLDILKASGLNVKARAVVATLVARWDNYFVIVDKLNTRLGEQNAASTATAYRLLNGELDKSWSSLHASISDLQLRLTDRIQLLSKDATAAAASARRTVLVTGGCALLLALFLGVATVRSIVRPLHLCVLALKAVATGDLTVTADVSSGDEVGQLAQALTAAHHSRSATLTGVGDTAGTLAAAADELSTANKQVATAASDSNGIAVQAAASRRPPRAPGDLHLLRAGEIPRRRYVRRSVGYGARLFGRYGGGGAGGAGGAGGGGGGGGAGGWGRAHSIARRASALRTSQLMSCSVRALGDSS